MTPRLRRWLFAGVALIALVAAGLAVALYRLNAYLHDHRDALAVQASVALGRTVRFGSLGVSVRGGLSARITDLQVADDPRFAAGDCVRADQVYIAIDLLPALIGRYRIRRVVLDAPAITIIRTAAGWNVDTLGRAFDATPPAARAPEPTPAVAPHGGAALASLLIASVTVHHGRIELIDRRSDPPTDVRIDRLEVSASDIAVDSAMRFELRAALLGAPDQNLLVAGSIDPRPPYPLDIRVALGPLALDGLRALPGLRELIPPPLSSPDPVSLTVHVGGTRDALHATLDADASAAALRYGALFRKPSGTALRLRLTAEVDGTPASGRLDVQAAQLTLGSALLTGHGRLESGSPPMLDATIELAPAPLAELAALVPPLAAHGVSGTVAASLQRAGSIGPDRLPPVSGRVELRDVGVADLPVSIRAFTGTIEIDADRAVLPQTIVQIGDAPVAVACAASPLSAPILTCTATADRLTSSGLGVIAAENDALHAVQLTTTLQPGEPLRAELRTRSGTVRGVAYRDLQLTARVEPGAAIVERLVFSAFDGSLRGSGSVRGAASAAPTFELHATVDGLRLTSLLASQGVAEARRVDGRLHADLTLAGSGRDWPSIRQTLRGGGRADVTDGVLRDVNLAEQVLNGLGGLGGLTQLLSPRVRERHPGIFRGGDTRFEALGASVRIGEGRAVTDDARLRARDFTIDSRGTVSLDGRLDLRGTFAASPELTNDLIGGIKEARGLANRSGQLEVPFTVSGTVADARVRPDRDFVANALQQSLIEQGLSSLLDKANKKGARNKQPKPAAPLLQKGLEKLFGR